MIKQLLELQICQKIQEKTICKNCSDHLELFLEFTWLKTKILEPLRYVTTISEIDIVVSWAAIAARLFEGRGVAARRFLYLRCGNR